MENYRILEAIGEGSFGRVFRGQCKRTGKVFALKFIPKRNKVERELKSLRRECEIQKELFHPNIVRMVDAFETEGEVVAVSEYVPIQLYSLLEKSGTLPEEKVRSIACSLISAIYYLHSLRILHRDIKPQNILLTLEGEAKLCDFGFSRKMGINTYVLTSIKGTPLYMAPELIDESPYDHTADLWSLGCILFELLTGKPPFCTTSIVQLIKMVHLEPIKWPSNLSENCKAFLEGLLQKEPSQRLTWPHLLEHPWVKDEVVVVDSVDPSPLTCPLSLSQQEIKEEQRRKLLKQGLSQQKIIRNFSKFGVKTGVKLDAQNTEILKDKICIHNKTPEGESLVEAMEVTNDIDHDSSEALEMVTFKHDSDFNQSSKKKCGIIPNDVDVRAAVGSSIRKLSTISQESGFKDEDVADITLRGTVATESRKDSMINYLSNSVDSSRRGSRPSFPMTENFVSPNLPNINEESFGKFSPTLNNQDIQNSNKPIEKEEWGRFLDKTMSEVMNESSFDIYYQHTEMNMFLSPLQNSSCPLVIIDKIAIFLMFPFVMKLEVAENAKVLKVYADCKVVPNLIYSLKLVCSSKSSSSKLMEYNKTETRVVQSLISLVCYLIHTKEEHFLTQFCDAVCIFSVFKTFGNLLFYDIHSGVTDKLLSVLNFVLVHYSENGGILEQILPTDDTLCLMLERFVNHKSPRICVATCLLIGNIAKSSCAFIPILKGNPNLLSDLINLETHPNEEIQRSASCAVSNLLKLSKIKRDGCANIIRC